MTAVVRKRSCVGRAAAKANDGCPTAEGAAGPVVDRAARHAANIGLIGRQAVPRPAAADVESATEVTGGPRTAEPNGGRAAGLQAVAVAEGAITQNDIGDPPLLAAAAK